MTSAFNELAAQAAGVVRLRSTPAACAAGSFQGARIKWNAYYSASLAIRLPLHFIPAAGATSWRGAARIFTFLGAHMQRGDSRPTSLCISGVYSPCRFIPSRHADCTCQYGPSRTLAKGPKEVTVSAIRPIELYSRGKQLAESGRIVQGLACMQEFLLACPADVHALREAGIMLWSLGRLDEATEHLRSARRNSAEPDPSVLEALVEVRLAAGDVEGAEEAGEKAHKLQKRQESGAER